MFKDLLKNKFNLVVTIIIIVLLYNYYSSNSNKVEYFENIDIKNIKFKNNNSIRLFNDIQDDLTKRKINNIYSSNLDINGFIMWKNVDFMEYILLTDEAYLSYEPKKVCNNLKIAVKFYINDIDINDILSLNIGLSYDRIKNVLSIRGDNLHYVLVILSYVIKVNNNIRDKEKLKDLLNKNLQGKLFLDDYIKLYDECLDLMKKHHENNKLIFPTSC